jgi:hypothetical protein
MSLLFDVWRRGPAANAAEAARRCAEDENKNKRRYAKVYANAIFPFVG